MEELVMDCALMLLEKIPKINKTLDEAEKKFPKISETIKKQKDLLNEFSSYMTMIEKAKYPKEKQIIDRIQFLLCRIDGQLQITITTIEREKLAQKMSS
jgi:hypothetical protein